MESHYRVLRRLRCRRASAQQSPFPESDWTDSTAPFRYFYKGTLTVVGKNFAVLQNRGVQVSSFVAWLVWAIIHIQFLAESSLRFSVFLQWVWTYVSGKRGERLIIRRRTSD
jgi:NADH dehydrogenase FAD-containing subunit